MRDGFRSQAPWLAPLGLSAFQLLQLANGSLSLPGIGSISIAAWAAWLALVTCLAVGLAVVRRRPRLQPVEWLAIGVLAAALVSDQRNSTQGGLRDLSLYLHAGGRFLTGDPVYTTVPLTQYPSNLTALPFLYPPPTLPLFAALSVLPTPVSGGIWLVASIGAAVASLRLFGLSWRWASLALLWTPFEQGIFVGNVAIPGLLLFALAVRLPWLLPLGPLLKPQNAIAALWLLRDQVWRHLAIGIAVLIAIVLVTVPLTGFDRWQQWLAALIAYADSQRLHLSLYGVGLGRWLPGWLFVVTAVGVTVGALLAREREGLARLGLASVVASPSLWSHGFVVAIPCFLRLRSLWLYVVAGLLCTGEFPGPQLALAIGAASFLFGGLVRRDVDDREEALHPLGRSLEPWPSAEQELGARIAESHAS